tara:strand:+ start:1810 stop:2496 length:687 start_codon:yes stop_codon:yes gene_type:complete
MLIILLIALSKRSTEEQKKEILNYFLNGKKIKDIAIKFDLTIPTITRQLKKIIGEDEFKKIKKLKNNNYIPNNKKSDQVIFEKNIYKDSNRDNFENLENLQNNEFNQENFVEILPLTNHIELKVQRELASEPLKDFELPKSVFMIVNKSIELEPKILSEYPEWSFLPNCDLERKTLEIFKDINSAKKACSKNGKVIKVPNSNIFLIASNILKSKGISRIIFNDCLLSF